MSRPSRFVRPFLLLGALSLLACGSLAASDENDALVRGTVLLTEGDCMPVITPERCRKSTPVVTVQAFPVIALAPGGTKKFEAPKQPAVAEVRSEPDGTFEMSLPEGRYTLLTQYEGLWFPLRHTDTEWAPVEVNRGWVENVPIEIDRAVH